MKISIVESTATAQMATVLVKLALRTLEIFVKTCVKGSTVDPAQNVYSVTVLVKLVIRTSQISVKKHVH